MPLARIVTQHPNHAIPVMEVLRGKGYEVETVAPGAETQAYAELEIYLDRTRVRDALKQAAALVDSSNADVFLLPGTMAGAAPEPLPETVHAGPALRRRLVAEFATAGLAWLARAGSAASDVAGATQVWLAAQRARREALRHEKARQSEAARSDRERQFAEAIQRQRERAAQRIAERQELDAQNAAELERARIAAEAERQQQLQSEHIAAEARRTERERLAAATAHRQRAREEAVPASPLVAEEARVQAERSRHTRGASRRVVVPAMRYRRSGRDVLWRKAAFRAAAATLIFMLGWTLAVSREPASPVPAGKLVPQTPVAQEVPFGAATLPPNDTTSRPASDGVTVTSGPPAATAKPAAPAKQRLRGGAPADEVTVRHADEDVAEPVVIYHNKPKTPGNVRAQRDSVKRFNDLQIAEERDEVKRISDLD